jgi:outer membrane protein assembly factor BamB
MRRTLIAIALTVAAVAPTGAHAAFTACDWRMFGHDLGHSFAEDPSCAKISRLNASSLHAKWFMPLMNPVTAPPTVVDGVVYVGDAAGTFYALPTDPAPGPVSPLWTFDVTDTNTNSYGAIVDGAAVDDIDGTRVVVFAGGSTIYMLDANKNLPTDQPRELAEACADARPIGAQRCKGSQNVIEVESSPAIVHRPNGDTLVIVGMDFNEDPTVGRAGLLAFRVHTNPWSLEPVWKFDPETNLSYTTDATKDGQSGYVYTTDPLTYGAGQGHGCGNVWSSPAIAGDLAVFGVGNCGHTIPSSEIGQEGTVAVNVDTGGLAWRFAPRPNNGLDLDFGASPQLLQTGLVGEGGKDGTYYGFDPARTGTFSTATWSSHVATASDIGGMIGSSALGAVNGAPAIFATSAIPFSQADPGGSFQEDLSSPNHMFALHAISATDGHLLWDAPNPLPTYAAATYSNGIVFLADTVGFQVQAYDADTGALLWAHPLNGAPSSAPAIVGDSIYMGTGTAADGVPGNAAGIWAFQAVVPPV